MNINQLKENLQSLQEIHFAMSDGSDVPAHVHLTELGKITKNYIDCGGTHRAEEYVTFQLWYADDTAHRLTPSKILHILELGAPLRLNTDAEIRVEYQTAQSLAVFGLSFQKGKFILEALQTNCLAPDACGIPTPKPKRKLADLNKGCQPGSGCC